MKIEMSLGVALAALSLLAGPGTDRAKVIGWGWDTLASTASDVLEHAAEFDASGFDGTAVMIQRPQSYNFRSASVATNWCRKALAAEIPILREFARHRGLRESLLLMHFSPKRFLSWTDPVAWARFSENMATAAWLAKEGGLRGLFIDPEDYPNSKQFFWDEKRDGMDYDAACRLAECRGRQMGAAIFREYPTITILSTWFLSMEQSYFIADDPAARMRQLGDLWPSFVAGFVSEMPRGAVLADGDEHGYHCDADHNDFYKHAWNQRTVCPRLLKDEHRSAYFDHLSLGFGLYPDMFVNQKGAIWYYGPGADGTRVSRFTADVAQAAYVAESYVWVYGEKYGTIRWKPGANCMKVKGRNYVAADGTCITWNDALPGFTDSIRLVTEPEALARETLARATTNCVTWTKAGFWQHRSSKGSWRKDHDDRPAGDYSLVAKGVSQGCFTFSIPVLPGEMYAISGAVKGEGRYSVTWSSKDLGLSQSDRKYLLPRATELADGWKSGAIAVCVPPGMSTIEIHATPDRQGPDDECRFADLKVVKIFH